MIRVHVICEGQTEEWFVKELLIPHLRPMNVHLQPALIGKPGQKSGGVKFARLLIDVRNRLLGDSSAWCTTLIDYYGLPGDFPGKADAVKRSTAATEEKAVCVRAALAQALEAELGAEAMRRFIPYVQMHEFEALLFSDTSRFAAGIGKPNLRAHFQEIRDQFPTPEAIDDSPRTAPSKRIEQLVPDYEKPLQGILAALEIGLSAMRRECPVFEGWLRTLESLAQPEA